MQHSEEEAGGKHKAGFVNIIGKPNVGKSTIVNALVGEKLAIITSKAQTTRHRIIGIINGADFQIVISDTPGIMKPAYKLQDSMMSFVKTAFTDADVMLAVIDVTADDDISIFEDKFKKTKVPKILILNKIDLLSEEETILALKKWSDRVEADEYIPVSALKEHNIQRLFDTILKYLPEAAPYYDKDAFTDRPERFFVSEIVREKILIHYKQEIPYSVEVVVEAFQEEETIIRMRAVIFTNKKSHKPILIGKGGKMLKRVGTEARKDMEQFFGKKVYLELFVKVKENWREDDNMLRNLGYIS